MRPFHAAAPHKPRQCETGAPVSYGNNEGVVMRRCTGTFRPDVTSHAEIVAELRDKINETALYPLSDTDVVKVAIEKMFERMTGKKPVSKKRKMYITLNF
jgi:hypothetical protein